MKSEKEEIQEVQSSCPFLRKSPDNDHFDIVGYKDWIVAPDDYEDGWWSFYTPSGHAYGAFPLNRIELDFDELMLKVIRMENEETYDDLKEEVLIIENEKKS